MSYPIPFRWPLAISPWSIADKIAIGAFIVSQDRYTMGRKTEELETLFSEFSGMHALMVANGSVANQLVFELWKLKNPGVTPVVICPAVTWISSLSPAMMAGCEIVFADVNMNDFALDYDVTERLVENWTAKGRRVIIWPTALIGFAPDMQRLADIAVKHGADLYLDSCENTFSRVPLHNAYRKGWGGLVTTEDRSILASAAMTTTSGYVSHQWSTVEGGFVFFRHQEDYDLGRLFRNHGLARSLPPDHPARVQVEAENPAVDPRFLFALAGTNMRPTDVHAMFGLADFKRIPQNIELRNRLYAQFSDQLDPDLYYLPLESETHVGFCFPIITRGHNLAKIKAALTDAGIENRPLIGGCLPGLQPPFRAYGPPERYTNAYWLHQRACYVGMHAGVTSRLVTELTTLLNDIGASCQAAA